MNILEKINKEQVVTTDRDEFSVGDSVTVHVRIKEGAKTRTQLFSGTVIAKNGSDVQEAFTVRRVTHGEGVERTFPLSSPNVEKIECTRKGKVRRAKLYYLRGLSGKKARIKEKRTF